MNDHQILRLAADPAAAQHVMNSDAVSARAGRHLLHFTTYDPTAIDGGRCRNSLAAVSDWRCNR
jgi:hypothetical protein